LIASLWVVATQVRASLTYLWECIEVAFKRKRGKLKRWRRSSAGRERVQALAGEDKPINFGGDVLERGHKKTEKKC
jgi:hypothetical protein